MNRKDELLEELNEIRRSEIEQQLLQSEENLSNTAAINELKDAEAKRELDWKKLEAEQNELKRSWWAHSIAWFGDFLLKGGIAFSVTYSFIYIVYQGTMAKESTLISGNENGYFELLSIVGPMMGMMLQYYFGKTKASTNGE